MPDYLEAADELQRQADGLLAKTNLNDLLGKLGEVIRTGSSTMGLMAYPDIDFTIQADEPKVQAAIDLSSRFFSELQATSLKITDFRLTKNEGASYFVGVDMPYGDLIWHIAATVGFPGPIITNPPELAEWLRRMTRQQRLTILTLKRQLLDDQRYGSSRSKPPYTFRSAHLYEAVLKGGANTVPEIEAYFSAK